MISKPIPYKEVIEHLVDHNTAGAMMLKCKELTFASYLLKTGELVHSKDYAPYTFEFTEKDLMSHDKGNYYRATIKE